MSILKPNFNTVIRAGALGTLLTWVIGLALCHVECLSMLRLCHAEAPVQAPAAVGSCHAGSHSTSHESGNASNPEDHQEEHCCCSLEVVSATMKTGWILSPVLLVFHKASIIDLDEVVSEPQRVVYCRQENWRQWTRMPEVCLGPANQSHAPPIA